MSGDYLDFDLALVRDGEAYAARVLSSPAGSASAPFTMPFAATDLAQFLVAVGPPRVSSRRLVPAAGKVTDVKDYGARLGEALLSGEVGAAFRSSLTMATSQGRSLRIRLRLDGVPELDPIPWEYVYDRTLDRFLTLSKETPVVRLLDALERPPTVTVEPPLRVLVMISSPSDVPALAVEREEQLLRATTGDLVKSGQLELVVLEDATLIGLQRALIDTFHVFHFIGHGGFDQESDEGVLVLEREDGTAHRVSGTRLGTLLHDARDLQLAVLNACEGARTSGRDAFSGVAQELVRRGLPAVVAMQTEISDRAALVFSHEFYYFLTRGLPIDAAICEVRKAMAVSDEASEWGTAVLLRSGEEQPFNLAPVARTAPPAREARWESLYTAAQQALSTQPEAALTMLEQLEAEKPDYEDVTALIQRVRPASSGGQGTAEAAGAADVSDGSGEPTGATAEGTWGTGDSDRPEGPDGRGKPDVPDELPRTGESSGPEKPTPRRRVGLLVGAGVLALGLGAGLAWTQLGKEDPGTLTTQPDVIARACGPAGEAPAVAGGIRIGCATSAPTVDGDVAEWASVPVTQVRAQVAPSQRAQSAGFTSEWQAQWDREALYLHAAVVDPAIRPVEVSRPSAFWMGDSVSFELGPDARDIGPTASLRSGRDQHVMIGLTTDGAVAAINPTSRATFVAGKLAPTITVAAARTGDGYEVEARIPWAALGLAEAPSRGTVLAGNFNVSDAAAARTWAFGRMVSSNPERTAENQQRPGTWQALVLADTG